ncbi:signal peptidase I [Enterococcus sp. PF1-24]|uniref:signal peptidase I n=1 Tax=unclassified Enterococcus TaxID=2608891 RepID=UPI0024764187|nr:MULTISPECIES: signal peptidase I [unclassified Enterococcus]MDH6364166.1 signal peptidase I [Enterococcus sp. PFB1-1]MDH6401267.1 signal peptidase I [Enterococcus sp. PF1-24]
MKKIIKELLPYIMISVVVIILRVFVFSPTVVDGISMEPTLEDHNYLIGLKNQVTDIERGDIVVFPSIGNPEESNYIKRVIGVGGDTLEMKDDVLFINGEKQAEPYLNQARIEENAKKSSYPYTNDFKVEVPENQIFVLGDNRQHSGDSRMFGCITEEEVLSVAKFRILPIGDFGKLK